jgi:hypothetical protein
MANLSNLVSYRRNRGEGVTSSLFGAAKDRLKERFDPRQLINQQGLMVALFPGLKKYQGKTSGGSRISGKSIQDSTINISEIKPTFQSIQSNTRITAKNLSVLPSIHRDFNVIRQNIVKLLKLEKIDARTKADMFFKSAVQRESLYESELSRLKSKNEEDDSSKIQKIKTGKSNMDLLILGGAAAVGIGGIYLAFKAVSDAIDRIRNVDIKDAMNNFTNHLIITIDKIMSSLGIDTEIINEKDVNDSLSEVSFSELSEDQKKKLLAAQAQSEGANKPGTIANISNNPGAMVYRDWMKEFGAEAGPEIEGPDKVKRRFAKFPTREQGEAAQRKKWESEDYANLPLSDALKKWVAPDPTSEKSMKAFRTYEENIGKAIGRVKPKPIDSTDVKLEGVNLKQLTGNFGTYGQMESVNNIILHHTGGDTLRSALAEFQRKQKGGYKHGSQFIIDRDGTIFNTAPETTVMYHAGTKIGKDVPSNWNSIGIEIVGKDSSSFTEEQVKSAKALVQALRKKHGNLNVFGHGELNKYGASKMPSEGKKLAEEIRKESDEGLKLKPLSLGNPSSIEDASFQVSMGNLNEEVPIVIINNTNLIQQNSPIVSQNQDTDPLDMLVSFTV